MSNGEKVIYGRMEKPYVQFSIKFLEGFMTFAQQRAVGKEAIISSGQELPVIYMDETRDGILSLVLRRVGEKDVKFILGLIVFKIFFPTENGMK